MQDVAAELDMSVDKMFSYKELIVGKIESPERAPMFIQVATNLIIRDSTGDLKETNH